MSAAGKRPVLVMDEIERFPIEGRTKRFATMNQVAILTVDTVDTSGATRGAVAYAMSHRTLDYGCASYSTIEEAEAIVALLQMAIADARRIEAGQAPLAPLAHPSMVKH